MTDIAARLIAWHRRHGRHDLPWQRNRSPYRVWVSEIMLQQTRVATVIPYFERFTDRFPDVAALAAASLDDVLGHWSGLGYYARARQLHRAAQRVLEHHGGVVPETFAELVALPGIGRSTAGAILALSRNVPLPVLDGNVKRVLTRHNGIEGWPGDRRVEALLWTLAGELVPADRAGAYTQAIMDLGATLCTRTRPLCSDCPVTQTCRARELGQQEQLPAKRPRRLLPEKHAVFAMLQNDAGEILLQRRPETGIWGGLWSFPECPAQTDVVDWAADQFDAGVEIVTRAPILRHTFTHFRLSIEPIHLRLRRAEHRIADRPAVQWWRPAEAASLGLAAPVRRLIEKHFPSEPS
ncbi:MAG: A/G-specific adenine glycosylase [Gammaproteobacteria bacterium]|nr:A/G-specific adenine glycosylase [Gammaproteobacteria bacterium]